MSGDLGSSLGDLILSGWISQAPDTGRDAAFLLLATTDQRARSTMPLVAETLGLNPAALAITAQPAADTYVTIDRDWVQLHIPGPEQLERPVHAEWRQVARSDGRVVLAVGYRPMAAGEEADVYIERAFPGGQVVIGILPLREK